MSIISLLRHKTKGKILRTLSIKSAVSHGELARGLSITSQGLTWQIHRLEKEGVIKEKSDGLKLTYVINDADLLTVQEAISVLGQ